MAKTRTIPKFGVAGAVLALYLNAGSIKANPLLAWIGVDLTLLLGLVLAVLLVFHVLQTGALPHSMWMAIGIATVFLLGVIPGALNPYGQDKALSFFTLTLLGMLGAAVLLGRREQRRSFLISLAVLGVVVAVLVSVFPARVSEWSTVITLAGTNTIATSRMILAGAIVVLMAAVLNPMRRLSRLALIALTGLMILTALNTGSRGPILAAGFALTLALLFAPVFAKRRLRMIIAVAVVASAGLIIASQGGGDGLGRISAFLNGEEDASAGARSLFWEIAWKHVLETPTGLGWGAFAKIPSVAGFFVVDGTLYPHNMLIEIALEAGLFAAAIIVVILLATFVHMRRIATTPATVICMALLIFAVLNAMLSGDINDNRLMWALIVGAWAMKSRHARGADAVRRAIDRRYDRAAGSR